MEQTKIKFSEKLGYGVGDMASNLIWTSAATFLTFFYTDIVGFSAAAVGTLLLIARFFDAFVDIGVGVLVDKTRSKHGKARPWLLWLAIPFGISGVLLFSAPDLGPTGSLIYAYVTYLLINIIYSGANVPYGVLNSLITQDPYERSLLNIFRMVMAIFGAVAVSTLTVPIVNGFGGGKHGWTMTFMIYGVLAAVLFLITFRTTKERVKPSIVQNVVPLRRSLKALFRNKYWALLVTFMMLSFIMSSVNTAVNIYYAQYILEDVNLMSVLSIISFIPMLIGLLLIAPIIKKFGKRNSAIIGLVITIVGALITMIDPTNLTIVIIASVTKSLGGVPLAATMFAMLADTVEYGEWKTGMRTEGLVYSAGSFGSKAGSGLGAAIVGWMLAFGGYVGGQEHISESARSSILFMYIYLPIIISALMVVILYFYKLDKQFPQIVKELEEAKNM
ncbi:MFS transporter [Paenibacillus macquariensis]|uniref:Glycoside/pentoside/hexuronide:cation symporter, GPH family n=1 Tax=Paenibacillus macquariensis TaxID=948756 RepID=A0ABY1K7Z3_9BACL|nr:MFS transporter [Paenibacillus macquariensis]MEC0091178.1 MFS transporter [Paenibacillus macquariensis]OAB33640.1 sodium:melibiose symporter [Paenibacillus macquariensis subsp. macquariensis]SIR38706.1 glycoside/pentoside/hexuronide:cation symporter, GPH family [Paenibacillus macquariensis]